MRFIILFLFLSVSCTSFAIPVRLGDYVTYKGERYRLVNNLLESYFKLHPEKRPFPDVFYSNTVKQYTAAFEIKNSRIYLKEIILFRYSSLDSTLLTVNVFNELFPNLQEFELSGLNTDLILNRVNTVYALEKYYVNSLYIKVNNGLIVKIKRLNYAKRHVLLSKIYNKFKKTEEYKTELLFYDESIFSKRDIKKYIKKIFSI